MEQKIVLLYIPCPSKEDAKRIARELLDRRLIACGNILQSTSMYHWEATVRDETEFVLIIKTSEACEQAARQALAELHPYDTPALLSIPVRADEKYADWVNENTKNGSNTVPS